MDIDLASVQVVTSLSETSRDAFAGVEAEGFLPATVLKHYDVVFDYPARSFSIFPPGISALRGTPVPMEVDNHSVIGAPLATILEYLSGTVGAVKHLTTNRNGRRLTVSAEVKSHR